MSKKFCKLAALILAVVLIFSAVLSITPGTVNISAAAPVTAGAKPAASSAAAIQNKPSAATAIKAEKTSSQAAAKQCGCDNNPFIVVPGITDSDVALLNADGTPVLNDDGTPYVKGGFMVDESSLPAYIAKTLAWPLAKMLITQKDNGFTDAVYEAAKPVFWRQATNPDGTPVQNLQVVKYNKSFASLTQEQIDNLFKNIPLQSICEKIGYDHVYYFAFNIIGDPMATARELDQFIQMVKEQTGHKKVNILNASLGASIFTAYCEQFKDKGDVEKVVNVVALNNGSLILRDIYAGNLDLSDESLYRDFFPSAFANSDGTKTTGYLVNLLIRLMPKKILVGTLNAVMNGAMDAMLRCAPNFWAMIPKEDYPALADKWLSGPKYAECRAKTDAFYRAQLHLENNLKYMTEEKGLEFNNVCGYNLRFSYITSILGLLGSDKTVNSDSVIHIQSTSMGATAAPAGQQLPADYLAAHAGSKYISPDKSVDASTCAFPDNTWFFLNQPHEDAGTNSACMNLVGELFLNLDFKNINSDPSRFPQFNYTSNSKELRRHLVPEAKGALADFEAGKLTLNSTDSAELKGAIAQGQAVLDMTIGNQVQASNAAKRLENILIKVGYRDAPVAAKPDEVKDFFNKLLDKLLKAASDLAYKYIGAQGYSEKF